MKIFVLLLALALPVSAMAADAAPQQAAQPKQEAETKSDAKTDAGAKPAEKDGVYTCKYYTVNLPEGWKAIIPPTDQHGATNAIFATADGSSVVTMIIGSNGGEDCQTIATMFAEQFKAPNPPVQRNGQYTFSFKSQNTTAQAYVATQEKEFMVTTIMGNQRLGKNFLSKNVTSDSWNDLLPK